LDLRAPNSALPNIFLFYLAQGKTFNEIYKIMMKTLNAIKQMICDLDLKVEIVKEKKQPVFPQKNLSSSKNRYRSNERAAQMIFRVLI
jgi:hypothetical protein